jgi:hypothetical protein
MTPEDHLFIANILRAIKPLCKDENQFTSIVSVFANSLQWKYPNFVREPFERIARLGH